MKKIKYIKPEIIKISRSKSARLGCPVLPTAAEKTAAKNAAENKKCCD